MLHIVWTSLNFESTRIRFSARSALLKAEKILVRSFLSGQEIMKIILNPCKSKKIKRLFAFFYAHWGWEWSLVLDETRWFGLERLESQHGYLGLVMMGHSFGKKNGRKSWLQISPQELHKLESWGRIWWIIKTSNFLGNWSKQSWEVVYLEPLIPSLKRYFIVMAYQDVRRLMADDF